MSPVSSRTCNIVSLHQGNTYFTLHVLAVCCNGVSSQHECAGECHLCLSQQRSMQLLAGVPMVPKLTQQISVACLVHSRLGVGHGQAMAPGILLIAQFDSQEQSSLMQLHVVAPILLTIWQVCCTGICSNKICMCGAAKLCLASSADIATCLDFSKMGAGGSMYASAASEKPPWCLCCTTICRPAQSLVLTY